MEPLPYPVRNEAIANPELAAGVSARGPPVCATPNEKLPEGEPLLK